MDFEVRILQLAIDVERWSYGSRHDPFRAGARYDKAGDSDFISGLGKDASRNVH